MKKSFFISRRSFSSSVLAAASLSPFISTASCTPSTEIPSPAALSGDAEAVFRKAQDQGLPGAVIGVQQSDHALSVQAFGVADVETKKPMQEDMWLRVGSVSKLFVGYIILRLIDENLLSVDVPLSQFRSDAPNGELITIGMLGNHTSGIYNPIYSKDFRKRINKTPSRTISRDEMLEVAWESSTSQEAIGEFNYSNANTALLADIAEQITGASINDLLKKYVFESSNAKGVQFTDSIDLPQPFARGYRFGPRGGGVEYGKYFFDATKFSPSWADAAGSVAARLPELLSVGSKVARGEGLSEQTRALQRRFIQVSPNYGYGFCLETHGGVIGHAGDVPGYSSFVGWSQEKGMSIAILTNLSNFVRGGSPAIQMGKDYF